MTDLNPYLHFDGEARAAMEHYRSVLGGELELTTFGQAGKAQDAKDGDRVMHSQLTSPSGLLMAGDAPLLMELSTGGQYSVCLSGSDPELRRYWEGLTEGGTVIVPLDKAPWGDSFGMCDDRFGIRWLVNIRGAAATEA